MKFLIYGAGAVGSYLGARLGQAGHEVTLISRSKANVLTERGLTLQLVDGSRSTTNPTAVATLRQSLLLSEESGSPYDYILLTMKAYDVQDAINEMLAFCPDNQVPLVTFQNGLGVEEKFTQHFDPGLVIAATLTTPVQQDAAMLVSEVRGDRGVALASVLPSRMPRKLVDGLRGAGIDTAVVKTHHSLKWSKALVNVMGNATAAITNRKAEQLYRYRPIFKLEMRMLQEILAVMKAQKISVSDLPGTPINRLITAIRWVPEFILQGQLAKRIQKGRGEKLPSFHLDLLAGKSKNEVLFLNGEVHRQGQELGVDTAVNGALTDILLQLVYKEIAWEQYDGKPKEFVQAVNEHIRQQRK